ncbi:hypothetical protein Btru_077791 [Bulinus truncatus]|nr:hypothetical protein Btru_077791 [Bulinus truncatus]
MIQQKCHGCGQASNTRDTFCRQKSKGPTEKDCTLKTAPKYTPETAAPDTAPEIAPQSGALMCRLVVSIASFDVAVSEIQRRGYTAPSAQDYQADISNCPC